jgi:hypothetical protein
MFGEEGLERVTGFPDVNHDPDGTVFSSDPDFGRDESPLALSWTLWAGLMTVAGAMARRRLVLVVSALGGGGTAVFLTGWQVVRLLRICGGADMVGLRCLPGPGVALALTAGAFAVWQAWRVLATGSAGRGIR